MEERTAKSPEQFTFHLRKNTLLVVMIIEVEIFKCSSALGADPVLYIGFKEETNAKVAQMGTPSPMKL